MAALTVAGSLFAVGLGALQVPVMASADDGVMTYTLHVSENPTADESDAYAHIREAMDRAVALWNADGRVAKHLNVFYVPDVPTADANYAGDVRFGSDRSYMSEGTALHEIGHTLGIGQSDQFFSLCATDDWPSATALLRSWDGPDAEIHCDDQHIWPYGLNYADEFSELAYSRNVALIRAMIADGLQGPVAPTGSAPRLLTAEPPSTARVGEEYAYAFTAEGSPDPVFAVAEGDLPPGLVLDASGVLSGIPTTAGSWTFRVSASNGVPPAATSETVTITVAGAAVMTPPPIAPSEPDATPAPVPTPVSVTSPSPVATLAATGSDVRVPGVIGALLLAGGAAVLSLRVSVRTRRR